VQNSSPHLKKIGGSIVREQLEKKKKELMAEFNKGQEAMAGLNEQAATVSDTLKRIQGAYALVNEQIADLDKVKKPKKK